MKKNNKLLLTKVKRWSLYKKGFVGLWADVFKGFFVGVILGILVMILIVLNIIPFPVSFCG